MSRQPYRPFLYRLLKTILPKKNRYVYKIRLVYIVVVVGNLDYFKLLDDRGVVVVIVW